MVDWRNPTIVAAENAALIRLVHVTGGIYIWEFISCLGFEYSVIKRKRRFTWPFVLYLGCRWCPLFVVTSQFLGFDSSHKINCQAWAVLTFMFGYLSFIFASALVILRIAVLWDHSKIVITFACAVWLGNIATYAYSLATIRSTWMENFCAILHTGHGRISVLSTFATDIILIVLMLTGLMRWKNAPKACGVWRLLRMQGFAWVVIVTLAEVPPTVFILLDLNDPLNLIFQSLALIITALGAARTYRGLFDYSAFNSTPKVIGSIEWANEFNRESVSPFSHQSCRKDRRHDAKGRSVVLDTLPVTTSGSEVHETETFERDNIV